MKKFFVLFLAVIMLISLIACARQPDGGTPEKSDGYIAVVLMALNQDYWHIIEAGANMAAKELGVEIKVVGPKEETDVAGQISLLEDSINAGCIAIALAPTEPSSLVPVLQTAQKQGIPVVMIDSDIEGDDQKSLRDTFIGTSEYDGGKLVGEYLAANLPTGAKVGIVRGPLGAASHNMRVDGAMEVAVPAGIEFVDTQSADSDRGKAVTVTENMLEAHPDISALYCTNDEMAVGAYQACESKNRTDILIVGFDGAPDCLQSILDGKVSATLAQSPFEMGYQSIQVLVDTLNNGEYTGDAIMYIPCSVIDNSTAQEYLDTLSKKIEEALNSN